MYILYHYDNMCVYICIYIYHFLYSYSNLSNDHSAVIRKNAPEKPTFCPPASPRDTVRDTDGSAQDFWK
jgi:hypothetical protein